MCFMHLYIRYMNENGTRYNPLKSQSGPYGREYVFTGPKVRLYFIFSIIILACSYFRLQSQLKNTMLVTILMVLCQKGRVVLPLQGTYLILKLFFCLWQVCSYSFTTSSHWEQRTLHHALMNGHVYKYVCIHMKLHNVCMYIKLLSNVTRPANQGTSAHNIWLNY